MAKAPKPAARKSAPPRRSPPAARKSAPAASGPLGASAAYEALLQVAQALPTVTPMAGSGVDPDVIQTNVDAGLAAVAPYRERILRELPTTPLAEVERLGDVARALIFATTQVVPSKVTADDVQRVMRELLELREPALKQLEVFAAPAVGAVPAAVVERIRAGSGPRNMAEDAVALAAAYRDPRWKLAGRHPLTDAQLARLDVLGNWVLTHVKADGAPTPNARVPGDAQEVVDRFFTLLQRDHAALRRVGHWLFGEDGVDAKVPKLGSRTAAPRAEKPAEEPKPAPTP